MCQPKPGKRCASHARTALAKAQAAADTAFARTGEIPREEVSNIANGLVLAQAEYDATDTGRLELATATTEARRAAEAGDREAQARYEALTERQEVAHTLDEQVRQASASMPDPRTYNPTDTAQRAAWERLASARYDHAAATTTIVARYMDGGADSEQIRSGLVREYRESLQKVRDAELGFRSAAHEWQTAELNRASLARDEALTRSAPDVRDAAAGHPAPLDDLRAIVAQRNDPALTGPVNGMAPVRPGGWAAIDRYATPGDWPCIAHLTSGPDGKSPAQWDRERGTIAVPGITRSQLELVWAAGYRTTVFDREAIHVERAPDMPTWAHLRSRRG